MFFLCVRLCVYVYVWEVVYRYLSVWLCVCLYVYLPGWVCLCVWKCAWEHVRAYACVRVGVNFGYFTIHQLTSINIFPSHKYTDARYCLFYKINLSN